MSIIIKRLILGAVLVLIIILTSFAVGTYIYRELPPEELKDKAWTTVEKARAEEAARYAKDELMKAERAYRIGISMLKREMARVYFLRNFEVSKSLFQDAIRNAESAMDSAKETRDSLKSSAESNIERGKRITAKIAKLRTSFMLDSVRTLKWSRAKITLHEAEIYYRKGEFAPAAQKASDTIKQLEEIQNHAIRVAKRFINWNELKKWRGWINETIEFSRRKGRSSIIVDKLNHTLILYKNGKRVKSFQADLGSNFINEKYYEGDNATPEGKYKIIQKRGKGRTKYYKALLLNYPSEKDKQRFFEAKRKGYISRKARIGGMIEIHGEGGKDADWTEGCVALSNSDIDVLFRHVNVGTPVTIVGSAHFNKEFAKLINTN